MCLKCWHALNFCLCPSLGHKPKARIAIKKGDNFLSCSNVLLLLHLILQMIFYEYLEKPTSEKNRTWRSSQAWCPKYLRCVLNDKASMDGTYFSKVDACAMSYKLQTTP
jgi:hypothetical protein